MMAVAFVVLAYIRAFLVSRHRLALEVIAVRQQLAVWKRKQPRPKLKRLDRLFWITLCRLWTDWRKPFLSLSQRLWSAGIVLGFDCSGVGDHVRGVADALG